uniref:Uncharacterized protein n=1 Tax=Rhodosorus marinus TaxID=101924 RepID=A0A7S2ZPQ3_9RHOD|mmetsp:Transcript_24576/g.97018  ORF Transcript_24576/g.97018 Transcript_24576/m.97018 type:complete len:134 (+) Transcript_24576:194-595(+)
MNSWIPKTRPSLWNYGMKSEAKESWAIRLSELSILERDLEKEMEAIRKTEAPKPLGVRHHWEEEEEDVELFTTYDNEEGEENSSDGLLSSNTDAVLDESDDMDEDVAEDNDDEEDEELHQQARTGNWWFSRNQ